MQEQGVTLAMGLIGILIPVLGWLASAISTLNKTLSNLDKNLAVLENTQLAHSKEIEILFKRMDIVENTASKIIGKCETFHRE